MDVASIFHITTADELRRGLGADSYAPDRLGEDDFVHCAADATSILAVAVDYFADADSPVLVLEIDVARLTSRLLFEAPAPIEGGGTRHLEGADAFPHVYGAIDRPAICGAGRLDDGRGSFRWPDRLQPLDALLAEVDAPVSGQAPG